MNIYEHFSKENIGFLDKKDLSELLSALFEETEQLLLLLHKCLLNPSDLSNKHRPNYYFHRLYGTLNVYGWKTLAQLIKESESQYINHNLESSAIKIKEGITCFYEVKKSLKLA